MISSTIFTLRCFIAPLLAHLLQLTTFIFIASTTHVMVGVRSASLSPYRQVDITKQNVY